MLPLPVFEYASEGYVYFSTVITKPVSRVDDVKLSAEIGSDFSFMKW